MDIHICDEPHDSWLEYIYSKYSPDSPHTSKHLFDIYTLTHIFWFIPAGYFLKNFQSITLYFIAIVIAILGVLFEVHENMPEQIKKYQRIEVDKTGEAKYRGDSTINLIGDIIGNSVGMYVGYNLKNITELVAVLSLFFIAITSIVGFSYWTQLFKFTYQTLLY